MVNGQQAKELQGLERQRAWEIRDGIHFPRKWNRHIAGDMMDKQIDGGRTELALEWVYNQTILGEPLKNGSGS